MHNWNNNSLANTTKMRIENNYNWGFCITINRIYIKFNLYVVVLLNFYRYKFNFHFVLSQLLFQSETTNVEVN